MDEIFIILGFFALVAGLVAAWCFFGAWRTYQQPSGWHDNERPAGLRVFVIVKSFAGLLALLFSGASLLIIVGLWKSTDL